MIANIAAAAAIAACSWDRPGHNPFTGPVPAAVERYTDIPPLTRAKLRLRMERRTYDDVAVITRDEIRGAQRYSDLRDMHFGAGQVCGTVTRAQWSDTHAERGLVYCEDGHCLIVPTVCRNVSRVTMVERARMPTALILDTEPVDLNITLIPPVIRIADARSDFPSGDGSDNIGGNGGNGGGDADFGSDITPRIDLTHWPVHNLPGLHGLPPGGLQAGVPHVAPVPEPTAASMLALGCAMLGIAAFRRRRAGVVDRRVARSLP